MNWNWTHVISFSHWEKLKRQKILLILWVCTIFLAQNVYREGVHPSSVSSYMHDMNLKFVQRIPLISDGNWREWCIIYRPNNNFDDVIRNEKLKMKKWKTNYFCQGEKFWKASRVKHVSRTWKTNKCILKCQKNFLYRGKGAVLTWICF